jgi:hypothetical protein
MPLLAATPASLREALRAGADRVWIFIAIKISLLRSWSPLRQCIPKGQEMSARPMVFREVNNDPGASLPPFQGGSWFAFVPGVKTPG